MKLTNKLNCLQAYVKLIESSTYEPNPDRVGVTALCESPKIRRLMIESWNEITADVSEFFERALGSAWHKTLEYFIVKTRGFPEVKWEYKIGDITLVGKTDALYPQEITEVTEEGIHDHKLVKAFSLSRKAKKENIQKWTEQLNIYNWLYFKCEGKQAKHLRVICYIKDWSSTDKQRDENYPNKIVIIPLEIWPIEKTEKFVMDRLELHRNKDYECTDEDKWIRPEGTAVMKKGRKTALAATKNDNGKRVNLDDVSALEWIRENNWLKEYEKGNVYLEHRVSKPRHCEEYCPVRSVCPFAKGLEI